MIRLHHLEKSRSHRVVWLLESLGLEYELVTYPRDENTQLAPDALKQIHPLGKSPVITDGELTVAESGAIIDYLIERYGEGRGRPDSSDLPEWTQYRYWLHYAEGSLMPPLLMRLIFGQVPKRSPWYIRPVAQGISDSVLKRFLKPQIRQHLLFIERHLEERGNFAGQWPSGADIQMSFPLQAVASSQSLEDYPAIAAFVARINADPAWQRAVKRAGPLTMPGM